MNRMAEYFTPAIRQESMIGAPTWRVVPLDTGRAAVVLAWTAATLDDVHTTAEIAMSLPQARELMAALTAAIHTGTAIQEATNA